MKKSLWCVLVVLLLELVLYCFMCVDFVPKNNGTMGRKCLSFHLVSTQNPHSSAVALTKALLVSMPFYLSRVSKNVLGDSFH